MKEYFYIDINGQQIGPVSEPELKYLKEANIISNETYVWKEGMPDWLSFAVIFPKSSTVNISSQEETLIVPDDKQEKHKSISPAKKVRDILRNKITLISISVIALICISLISVSLFSDNEKSNKKEKTKLRQKSGKKNKKHKKNKITEPAVKEASSTKQESHSEEKINDAKEDEPIVEKTNDTKEDEPIVEKTNDAKEDEPIVEKTPFNLEKTYELIEAADSQKYWLFEDLIAEGADINYSDSEHTTSAFAVAAVRACIDCDFEGLKILAKYNPNLYNCTESSQSIFEKLQLEANSYTYIYRKRHYLYDVLYNLLNLVDYKALPNRSISALCADKCSPMAMCTGLGYVDCVEKMLKNGVSPDDNSTSMHRQPLSRAIAEIGIYMGPYHSSNKKSINIDKIIDCFNLLIAYGANVNYKQEFVDNGKTAYQTPLITAATFNLEPIVKRLINEGADVNLKLNDEMNLLGYLLRNKLANTDILICLIQAGASVENDPEAKRILEEYEDAIYVYNKVHGKK